MCDRVGVCFGFAGEGVYTYVCVCMWGWVFFCGIKGKVVAILMEIIWGRFFFRRYMKLRLDYWYMCTCKGLEIFAGKDL